MLETLHAKYKIIKTKGDKILDTPLAKVGGKGLFVKELETGLLLLAEANAQFDRDLKVAALRAARAQAVVADDPDAPAREIELAERVVRHVPSVDRVRFVSSGTEATMSAIRLARGATGRDKIIKFSGNYHGHVDSLLVAAGSAAATLGVPNSPGVTEGTAQDTLVLPYNDPAALEAAFAEHGVREDRLYYDSFEFGLDVPVRVLAKPH